MSKTTTFELGRIVITRRAQNTLAEADWRKALERHARGDWGEMKYEEDRQLNDQAVIHGGQLLSTYNSPAGTFWIITDANREVTTILMPEDY